jgi:hypothetical protein
MTANYVDSVTVMQATRDFATLGFKQMVKIAQFAELFRKRNPVNKNASVCYEHLRAGDCQCHATILTSKTATGSLIHQDWKNDHDAIERAKVIATGVSIDKPGVLGLPIEFLVSEYWRSKQLPWRRSRILFSQGINLPRIPPLQMSGAIAICIG